MLHTRRTFDIRALSAKTWIAHRAPLLGAVKIVGSASDFAGTSTMHFNFHTVIGDARQVHF